MKQLPCGFGNNTNGCGEVNYYMDGAGENYGYTEGNGYDTYPYPLIMKGN